MRAGIALVQQVLERAAVDLAERSAEAPTIAIERGTDQLPWTMAVRAEMLDVSVVNGSSAQSSASVEGRDVRSARGPAPGRGCRACLRACSRFPGSSGGGSRGILSADAIAAVHVTRQARDVQRLAGALLRLSSDTISGLALPSSRRRLRCRQASRPSVISVCMSASFFWINWLAASGRPELLAIECILARGMPAEFCRAHGAPADAEARVVEAGEGGTNTARLGQALRLRDEHVVHQDHSGG
jgi:hypothetical protein